MTDLPWIFSVTVRTPEVMRAPDLSDPDSWNVEGLDQDNWDGAELVADAMERELGLMVQAAKMAVHREMPVPPAGTLVERDTKVSVQVTTSDMTWFNRWYRQNPHADMVLIYQTPTLPKDGATIHHTIDRETAR